MSENSREVFGHERAQSEDVFIARSGHSARYGELPGSRQLGWARLGFRDWHEHLSDPYEGLECSEIVLSNV